MYIYTCVCVCVCVCVLIYMCMYVYVRVCVCVRGVREKGGGERRRKIKNFRLLIIFHLVFIQDTE